MPGNNRSNSVIIAGGGGNYSPATSNSATSSHPLCSTYGNSNGGNHDNHRGCNVVFAHKSGNSGVIHGGGGMGPSSSTLTSSSDETSNNMFLEFLAASTAEQEMKDEGLFKESLYIFRSGAPL